MVTYRRHRREEPDAEEGRPSGPPPPLPLPSALPAEVTLAILSFITAKDLLVLEASCRQILLLVREPSGPPEYLWSCMIQRHWPWAQKRQRMLPSRPAFLHLRNLRFRPMASIGSNAMLHNPEWPGRTPSLRSVPQSWSCRSSPFDSPSDVVGLLCSPLAMVEECDPQAEPTGMYSPQGDPNLTERYNFAVLDSGGSFMPRDGRAGGWEVDFELCYAGWAGGLLGVVACEPNPEPSSVAFGDSRGQSGNFWCFNFTRNEAAFDEAWWDQGTGGSDHCLGRHCCPIFCDEPNAGARSLLTSESPTRQPLSFRMRLNWGNVGKASLELYLLDGGYESGNDAVVKRLVGRIDERSGDPFMSNGHEVLPFVAFSPLDVDGTFYLEPERSFAKVIRVVSV